MNAESVNWLPALMVLGIGLVAGAALVWRVLAASKPRASEPASLEIRDLTGKSEALIVQLRELEDTASKRTPEQLARERYALELEAARALLALDAQAAPRAPEPAAALPVRAGPDRAAVRGFLWGVATATSVLLLAFFVYQSAAPRAAGGSVTGEPGMAGRQGGAAAVDPEEAQLQAAIAANPNDIESRLTLARIYIERQQWMLVWNETTKVLEHSPGNPPATAMQALVRLAMGQGPAAVTMLNQALAADPNMIDAWGYLAMAYARTGRMQEAEATVERAAKRFPERAEDLRRFLAELKGNEGPMAAASAEGPDPHANIKGPGDAAPAPAAKRRGVSGVVLLDPPLEGAGGGRGILFIFARPAGGSEGPPIAAKRLPAMFPVSFELSEADSMMGQPLPDSLLIEARLDEDGDPTTRPPTDPKARQDGVKIGRTDLRLVLKRQ